eukprot:gene12056-biopygen5611
MPKEALKILSTNLRDSLRKTPQGRAKDCGRPVRLVGRHLPFGWDRNPAPITGADPYDPPWRRVAGTQRTQRPTLRRGGQHLMMLLIDPLRRGKGTKGGCGAMSARGVRTAGSHRRLPLLERARRPEFRASSVSCQYRVNVIKQITMVETAQHGAAGWRQGGAWWRRVAPRGPPWNLRSRMYSPVGSLCPQRGASWRKVAPRGVPLEPEEQDVLPGGSPFPAVGRMVAQGDANGGPPWKLRIRMYSPVVLPFPQPGACGAHGGAGSREGGSPLEPEAQDVLPGGTPVPAAGRMWDPFSRSGPHRGAGWRQGGSPLEPEEQDVLPGGTPFPSAGRMLAQGGAKGGPPWNLGSRMYSPVGLPFPQRGA